MTTMTTNDNEITMLLVDDDVRVIEALRRSLRAPGRHILTCNDPREVAALLARECVDVVISDNDMPGLSGIELLTQLRHSHPDMIRILLTGRSSLESALHAINRGEVYRYLTKPWNDDELEQIVAEAIDRLREHRRAAAADVTSERRRRLLADLEREHPGIATVERNELGAYLLDETRAVKLTKLLGL